MNEFDEAKAKQRFMLLSLVRFVGIAMVLVAIAISQLSPQTSPVVTIGLAFAGLAAFFFWPRKLASQWKSEDE